MKNFLSLHDVGNPVSLVQLALNLKQDPHQFECLGKRKTIGLVFLNPSLRTRMSMIRASRLIGLETISLNLNSEGWKLETEDGVIMDGEKAEHIKEAIAVMSGYCDLLAIRSFPSLTDRGLDYSEHFLQKVISFSTVPVINMESATGHPLQGLADLVTISELKTVQKPKIVLTWAPHPKALPQAVANSFVEWTVGAGYDVTIAHPAGFELSDEFTKGAKIVCDQKEALKGADFVYVKNWSSFSNYGQSSQDSSWMISKDKLLITNQAKLMHCLPVRRNVVISDDALDSDHSVVIRQAGNRICAAQAVLVKLLQENG